jgi:hypothetical protein
MNRLTAASAASRAGRIGEEAAADLGGWTEADGHELVAPHLDQAQLTGLLVQLSNLHIAFDRIVIDKVADMVASETVPNTEGVNR